MVEILMIGWILGIFSSIFGIIGYILFVRGIKNLVIDTFLKETLIYLAVTCISVIVFTTLIMIFGLIKLETTSKWWISFPVIYLGVVATSWGIGVYKLFMIVKEAKEENE